MSVEEQKTLAARNKDVVRRYVEDLWNNLQYDLIDQVLASDVLAHAQDGTQEQGNQRFRQVIPDIRTAFPDLYISIEQMIAEDDHVAVRLRVTGTHQGDLAGMAPTGKVIEFPEWFFLRLRDGKIVEYWYLRDQQALLHQLTQE